MPAGQLCRALCIAAARSGGRWGAIGCKRSFTVNREPSGKVYGPECVSVGLRRAIVK